MSGYLWRIVLTDEELRQLTDVLDQQAKIFRSLIERSVRDEIPNPLTYYVKDLARVLVLQDRVASAAVINREEPPS